MDQSLSATQLQALLEDAQASLAASFARIEAYRLQNRQLRDEVSALRNAFATDAKADGPSKEPVLSACSLTFPQQRNTGSHPIVIIDGSKKVRSQFASSGSRMESWRQSYLRKITHIFTTFASGKR